jgi:very-short-patch-repair endonuclease
MRKDMTPSEKAFWRLAREIEGVTIRRQIAVGDYVFDFGSYAARLLIEIDGGVHGLPDVQANDKAKEIFAVRQRFRVLRFKNEDVRDRPAWVVEQLRARLFAPHPPTPSPQGRGGETEQ